MSQNYMAIVCSLSPPNQLGLLARFTRWTRGYATRRSPRRYTYTVIRVKSLFVILLLLASACSSTPQIQSCDGEEWFKVVPKTGNRITICSAGENSFHKMYYSNKKIFSRPTTCFRRGNGIDTNDKIHFSFSKGYCKNLRVAPPFELVCSTKGLELFCKEPSGEFDFVLRRKSL